MSGTGRTTFLFAGGGTGGHLYPALAVAQAVAKMRPDCDIHFAGRNDKLEARVVPQYGYRFHEIVIEGLSRSKPLKNFAVIGKTLVGFAQSLALVLKLKPAAAVTTGSYISAPIIVAARIFGAKILMIEPNSYPGLTTRMFERFADRIYIAFDETRQYLRDQSKLVKTGNPIRISFAKADRAEAKRALGFDAAKKTVLVLGGSLGARALNAAVGRMIGDCKRAGWQLLWQTGPQYYDRYRELSDGVVQVRPYIDDMSAAYNAADLVISRSGATTIAEIMHLGAAAILVPSPNVTADHQTRNAESLSSRNAAVLTTERLLDERLFATAQSLLSDDDRLEELRRNARALANDNAAAIIANDVLQLAGIIN